MPTKTLGTAAVDRPPAGTLALLWFSLRWIYWPNWDLMCQREVTFAQSIEQLDGPLTVALRRTAMGQNQGRGSDKRCWGVEPGEWRRELAD